MNKVFQEEVISIIKCCWLFAWGEVWELTERFKVDDPDICKNK